MKKFRIAFTGVFDIANYGDHLFPIVFQEEMKKRKLNFQLSLFSPFAGKEALGDDAEVFALEDLEKMHLQAPFDAIVVGGGEVTHFLQSDERLQSEDTEYRPYPISQIWIIPSLVALKYNVPLLWNAPGANSFPFPESYHGMTRGLCSGVDYLCIRNGTSRRILEECGIDGGRIRVCPDTALLISDIIPIDRLEKIRASLLPFSQKYVVFHTSRFISEEGIDAAVKTLNSLEEQGYKTVLLPLAYSHGDDRILHQINQTVENRYYEFARKLSLQEMMSVLACCSLYIGSSFHGCVTALAYGKKAAVFDLFQNKKTEDLLDGLHLGNHFIVQPEILPERVTEILGEGASVDLEPAKIKLQEHFTQMFDQIVNPCPDAKPVGEFCQGYLKSLDEFRKNQEHLADLELKAAEIGPMKEYFASLEKQITEKDSYIGNKEQELGEAKLYVEKLETSDKEVKTQIHKMEQDHEELDSYAKKLKSELQEKEHYIAGLQSQLEEETQRSGKLESDFAEEKEKLLAQLNEKLETSFLGKIQKKLHK